MPTPADTSTLSHGARADLKPGDLTGADYCSNHGKRKQASWVYLTGTLDAAVWGTDLAAGDGPGRICIVEPTGPIVDGLASSLENLARCVE